jgi:ATP-dependent exoDNAse (exonuclease V) beta subunit
VGFNNAVFNCLPTHLQSQYNSGFTPTTEYLKSIIQEVFGQHQQTAVKEGYEGIVQMQFFRKKQMEDDDILQWTAQQIAALLKQGYHQHNIAVLVRNKKEGKWLADYLIEHASEITEQQHLTVLSNESLFLNHATAVQLMVAALKNLTNPDDVVNRAFLILTYSNYVLYRKNNDVVLYDNITGENCAGYNILPEEYSTQQESLKNMPVYDLCEQLISIFNLNALEDEVAYIQFFLDTVFDFCNSDTVDVQSFLEYWDEHQSSFSIQSDTKQEAIQILTLHKAKGLEFDCVLLPYCHWELNPKSRSVFWCASDDEAFGQLPAYPVNFTKSLVHSHFKGAYIEEVARSYIDNLNLLYVGFTRAKKVLYAAAGITEPKKGDVTNVGDLLFENIQQITGALQQDNAGPCYFDENKMSFYYGQGQPVVAEPDTANVKILQNLTNKGVYDKLTMARSTRANIFSDENRVAGQMRGELMHKILQQVTTYRDIPEAVARCTYNGMLTAHAAMEIEIYLKNKVEAPAVKQWFTDRYFVRNEADLIVPGESTLRPDRVMVDDGGAVVILDYKFGETEKKQHHGQLRSYADGLKMAGYRNVKAYLWYVDRDCVVEVTVNEIRL